MARAEDTQTRKTLDAGQVLYEQFLNEDGTAQKTLPDFATGDELKVLYRAMVLTRALDAKAVSLQRTGKLGTYASSLGQEAVSIGAASAMRPEDVLLPSFREQGAQLWRGVSPKEILLYWGGDERGNAFSQPGQDFPVCIPVASHTLHAAGVALAFQLREEPRATVCIFGDGATSKGDFYEALNLAGAWTLPCVFVVNNNQWAISVPRSRQTAAATLAQKATAAGMEGIQTDGNDVIAVRHVVTQALRKARSGGGPTLVEALTYRLSDHTTADDASRYRDDEEVSAHWLGEPVARLRSYLSRSSDWSKDNEQTALNDSEQTIDRAVEDYLKEPPQSPASMFDHLYANLPSDNIAERSAARAPRAYEAS